MNSLEMRNLKYIFIFLIVNLLYLILITKVFEINVFSVFIFTSQKEQPKYIFYECSGQGLCGGLVDRFKGIMNAYAWSLFTKRRLIIKITKPYDFINLMVPSKIKWNFDLENLVKYGDLKADYTKYFIRKLDDSGYKSVLENMNIINYQNESDIISIFTNLEWISAFAKNKYGYFFVFFGNLSFDIVVFRYTKFGKISKN